LENLLATSRAAFASSGPSPTLLAVFSLVFFWTRKLPIFGAFSKVCCGCGGCGCGCGGCGCGCSVVGVLSGTMRSCELALGSIKPNPNSSAIFLSCSNF